MSKRNRWEPCENTGDLFVRDPRGPGARYVMSPMLAVRRTEAGYYVMRKGAGWLHHGGEIWFFAKAAEAMEMADAASPDDFSWCGQGYGPQTAARRPGYNGHSGSREETAADLMDDAA
jgi:hypothetical protein